MKKKILTVALAAALASSLGVMGTPYTARALADTPTGVVMTFYDDIYSRGFAWQTGNGVRESKLVIAKHDADGADWENAQTVDGSYVTFRDDYHCHKAQISNLEAGVTYSYKVGGNGVYSDVGTFTVEKDPSKCSFVYVTDSQETSVEGFKQWEKTLKTATETLTPDFIAFAGDLVDNSHANWGSDMSKIQMQEWSYAFDVPKDIILDVPFMSAAGNHESAGYTFVNHSNINFAGESDTGGYYSFDYGDVHFVTLNTNAVYNESNFSAQLQWLEEDLATTDKKFKLVMMHMGAYSTGDHSLDSETVKIRNLIPQIMAKYEVDLVMQGHDHVYTRTMPYYYGEGENGKVPNREELLVETKVGEGAYLQSQEPDGTYYVTINYAGTKSYPPVEYDTSRIFPATSPVNGKAMSQHVTNRMFATVEVEGDELLFRSFIAHEDGSSELYDYFYIRKNTYQEAAAKIDGLPEAGKVTARNARDVASALEQTNALSHRGLKRLGAERTEKLDAILASFRLADALAAVEAIEVIDLLNPLVTDEAFWKDYARAKNIYYNLSETQKEMVDNGETLVNMEKIITETMLVERVQVLIDAIPDASDKNRQRTVALEAYNLLSEEAKVKVKNTHLLTEEEKSGCASALTGECVAAIAIVLAISAVIVVRRKRDESN